MAKNCVGLDIGSSAIKIVQVKEAGKRGYSLVNFGIEPIPPQTIVDGTIMNQAAVVDAIREIYGKLGINNLRAHFGNLEKELRREFHNHQVTEAEVVVEAQKVVGTSPTFQELVVQRSRAYARESQIRETGNAAVFPERKPPKVAEYSIKKTVRHVEEELIRKALHKTGGNRTKAAEILEISHRTLLYKIKEFGIDDA